MVDTRKFSEFVDGGNLENDDITVGLRSGNTKFDNPLPMLPPGTTAERPTVPDAANNWRLRFNTTDGKYEYYSTTTSQWETVESSGGGSTVLALLASHASGEGASLVGLEDQGAVVSKTVQDLANATLIAQTDNGTIANGQFLEDLDTGIMKSTTSTGVVSVLTDSEGITAVIDDYTMATASDTSLATSESIKEYVDNSVTPSYPITLALDYATTSSDFTNITYNNGASGVGATITSNVNGALTVDGANPNTNDLVLVKHGTIEGTFTAYMNGIYDVTDTGDASNPFVLTRSTAFDEVSEFTEGDAFSIANGSVNSGTTWVLSNAPTAIAADDNEASYIGYANNTSDQVSGFVNLIKNQSVYGIKAFEEPVIINRLLSANYMVFGNTPTNIEDAASYGYIEFNDPFGGYQFVGVGAPLSLLSDATITITPGTGNNLEIVTSSGGLLEINSTTGVDGIIDDDTMATASATTLATSESIKAYIDSVIAMFNFLSPVRVATTGNFASTYDNGSSGVGATLTATSNGAASIDGVSLSLNDRVLFKDQTTNTENGIYYVTTVGDASNPAVYTRSPDFDTPEEMTAGEIATVTEGTTNANTGWLLTSTVTTVGSDPIIWVDFIPDITNVVTLNGAQTITGAKTFSATTTFSGDVDFGLTDGQLLIGDTGNPANKATLTAGTGVTINNSSGSIEISASGGGLGTATIAGTSDTAVVNTRYIALNSGQTTLTLPSTFSVGDIVELVGSTANTGGWVIQAPAGDTVRVNNSTTTSGGTVTSDTEAGQVITLIADVANTSWVMTSTVSTILTTA